MLKKVNFIIFKVNIFENFIFKFQYIIKKKILKMRIVF